MVKKITKRQSSRIQGSHTKAYKEGLGILKDEIQLAFLWQRPSILLAIHNSKTGQLKAQQALEYELRKSNINIRHIKVEEAKTNVVSVMSETPHRDKTIFFVSGSGGIEKKARGNFYNALNFHRELLVDHRIRVVFWLTELEATNLPRYAPDFWAFRHRVVEFASNRGTKKNALPAGLLLWKNHFPFMNQKMQINELTYHEKILADLPQDKNAFTTRLETLLMLMQYYWFLNNTQKFSDYLADGFALAGKNSRASYFHAWLLNAKGIAIYEKGTKDEASSIFKKALTYQPLNSIIMTNLGITAHALGKGRDSIIIIKQAIKQDLHNSGLWHVLGHLYLSMGKIENAIDAVKQAQHIEPENINTHYLLAVCYYKNDQFDACSEEINKAGKISVGHDIFQRAWIQIMTGNAEAARIQLKQALDEGELTKSQILRDPNLHALSNLQEDKDFN
jgi:predicted Zn-dependent protease